MFIIINMCFQGDSVAINSILICFLISPKKLPAVWEIQSSVLQALARYKILQTRQKLLQFSPYKLICNLFLSTFWTLSKLERRDRDHIFRLFGFLSFASSKRNNIYSWLPNISTIFIFKSAGFSAENRTLLFLPFYRRIYLYFNSGRLPFGESGRSRRKAAVCNVSSGQLCIL